jgi:DNA ligase-1
VLGHLAGAGRHKGRLGALAVELPNGTRFSVGTGFSDAERSAPPPIGSTITFRYQELSEGGVPRFPSYIGVRHDAAAPPVAPAPAAKAPKPVQVVGLPSGKRYFELVEGKSSKFWEVEVRGLEMTTRWGRIGSAGQSKTKALADEGAATAAAAKLIAEKTKEGYMEQ